MFKSYVAVVFAGIVLMTGTACMQSTPLADSPEARLEQARALTALEVQSGALDDMLDEGAALAREATADMLMLELEREPTEEQLAQLEAIMRESLAEFLTADLWQETVAGVYARHFTAAELQQAVAFYGSPMGRKILGLQSSLDAEVGDAVEAVLEVHSDEFTARVDKALEERFPELTEEGS